MSLTAGIITLVSAQPTEVKLSATAASGGSGPYTQQWYRSTTTGFTPGGGNILSGKTALTLDDTGLVPGIQYFYVLRYTDTGNSNVTIDSAQFAQTTPSLSQSQNQFLQSPVLGQLDQMYNFNTIAAQVDSTQATPMLAGQAVKIVNSADGVPKVVACAANSDDCFGFINYNQKNINYPAGAPCSVSQAGNVIYLLATAAIARGARVQLDLLTVGGVAPLTGSSGADIVGWAFDKGTVGALLRVRLLNPSFSKA